MSSSRGGARPGAGRPSNAERYEEPIRGFTDGVAEHFGQVYRNLEDLADGRAEGYDEVWEAAGTIFRKDVARDRDGNVVRDKNGKPTVVEVRAFPDLPAEQLVLVGRKVRKLPPDFKANELMVERLDGKAAPKPPPDVEGMDLAEALDEADELIAGYVDPDAAEIAAEGDSPDAP